MTSNQCALHAAERRLRYELPCPWCVIDELKRNRDQLRSLVGRWSGRCACRCPACVELSSIVIDGDRPAPETKPDRDAKAEDFDRLTQCHREGWLYAQEVEDEYRKRTGHGFGTPHETASAKEQLTPCHAQITRFCALPWGHLGPHKESSAVLGDQTKCVGVAPETKPDRDAKAEDSDRLTQCHREGWLYAQQVEDEYRKRMGHGFGTAHEAAQSDLARQLRTCDPHDTDGVIKALNAAASKLEWWEEKDRQWEVLGLVDLSEKNERLERYVSALEGQLDSPGLAAAQRIAGVTPETTTVHDIPWQQPCADWPDISATIHALYDEPRDGHKGCGEIALAAAREIERLRTPEKVSDDYNADGSIKTQDVRCAAHGSFMVAITETDPGNCPFCDKPMQWGAQKTTGSEPGVDWPGEYCPTDEELERPASTREATQQCPRCLGAGHLYDLREYGERHICKLCNGAGRLPVSER